MLERRAEFGGTVTFFDLKPAPTDCREEIIAGLTASPKRLSPKYFYDERGSALFDAITRLPEYYPTRTEKQILGNHCGEIAECIGDGCLLVEPGSGSSDKVRLLLDALRPAGYVPIDISGDYLCHQADTLAGEYPGLDVYAVCADFTTAPALPDALPDARRVAFYPGSTIGNLEPGEAAAFLGWLRELVGTDGGLLLGVDRKKDAPVLNAAYNDRDGVTAAFNRNALHHVNRLLDSDFEPERFSHHAFYDDRAGRVEMHLVSDAAQRVRLDGTTIDFDPGESIHTECSYKYSIAEVGELAARAGFRPTVHWSDPNDLFTVYYLEVA